MPVPPSGQARSKQSSTGAERSKPVPGPPGSKVFVNNLSWQTTWHSLKDHFNTDGQVAYAAVLTVCLRPESMLLQPERAVILGIGLEVQTAAETRTICLHIALKEGPDLCQDLRKGVLRMGLASCVY